MRNNNFTQDSALLRTRRARAFQRIESRLMAVEDLQSRNREKYDKLKEIDDKLNSKIPQTSIVLRSKFLNREDLARAVMASKEITI